VTTTWLWHLVSPQEPTHVTNACTEHWSFTVNIQELPYTQSGFCSHVLYHFSKPSFSRMWWKDESILHLFVYFSRLQFDTSPKEISLDVSLTSGRNQNWDIFHSHYRKYKRNLEVKNVTILYCIVFFCVRYYTVWNAYSFYLNVMHEVFYKMELEKWKNMINLEYFIHIECVEMIILIYLYFQ
jgi:hypothetical protein